MEADVGWNFPPDSNTDTAGRNLDKHLWIGFEIILFFISC